MIRLANLDLVLPDRRVRNGSLVIDEGRIVEVGDGRQTSAAARSTDAGRRDLEGHLVVPGFIDVHVHGVEGLDTLGPATSIGDMAARLVKYGVTAFCPTTIACGPEDLERALRATRAARQGETVARGARVLPAHLESNFISPAYRGAQPLACLRHPPPPAATREAGQERQEDRDGRPGATPDFSGADILRVIRAYRQEVGIVTLAPELPHALDLIETLVADGHRVSLGHSGATLDQGRAAIDRGARHATHLFNRMPPFHHREPGLVGAVLERDEVAAEIVCDGYHVHPVLMRTALAAKRVPRIMLITDGTAGSGLPVGAKVTLAGRPITVHETACFLDDGTLAGSRMTMDRVFGLAVRLLGVSVVDAARLCASTQAEELGLVETGAIRPGAVADLAVLAPDGRVRRTYVGGHLVYDAS